MKRKQTQPREANTTIFVVGEGASEINYFNTLYTREGLGQAGISIRTNDLPVTATDYKALFRLAEQKAEVYDSVYCVIDMDAIHDKKVFRKYPDAKEGLKKKRPTIHVIESFPVSKYGYCFITHNHADRQRDAQMWRKISGNSPNSQITDMANPSMTRYGQNRKTLSETPERYGKNGTVISDQASRKQMQKPPIRKYIRQSKAFSIKEEQKQNFNGNPHEGIFSFYHCYFCRIRNT
ncbi:RloB domain-containing protein [Methanosarcinaceae archaeon]|nr:RloB domain-containing protein [Methanosarcinaceae archaeon]